MIEITKAIILGAVQGVTEFLPISSTGHLILLEHLFGITQEKFGLTFDAALHLGTLVAILWFYKKEFSTYVTTAINMVNRKRSPNISVKITKLLIIGTFPAVIIGLLLEGVIDTYFRSPLLVGVTLIFFSSVLWYVEQIKNKKLEIGQLTYTDGFIIGIAQSIALIPGVSRSGITIAAGMERGLRRDEAARFTFLLSAPIVAGAGGKKVFEFGKLIAEQSLSSLEISFFITGIITATVFGYLTIKYFLRFVSYHSHMVFVYYRIGLGLLVILLSLI